MSRAPLLEYVSQEGGNAFGPPVQHYGGGADCMPRQFTAGKERHQTRVEVCERKAGGNIS